MKNNFTIKKVGGAGSIGEVLQETRKRRGITLDEISDKLKIQKKYLKSLERSDYASLPADVYIKGFLKSYAEYLNMDYEGLLEAYKRERNIIENIKRKKGSTNIDKKHKSSSIVITPIIVKIGIFVLAILGLFFYLWYQISGLSSAPRLVVKEPYSDKTINEDAIVVIGETKPGADISINGQSVYVDPDGNFKENVGLQEGLNTLRIVAANRLDKENVVERKIMVEKEKTSTNFSDEVASGDNENEINDSKGVFTKNSELELAITIREKATWVHVEEDGKIAYSGTMLPDATQTFTANNNITISSGKANTTYVKFNGKDIGALGEEGEAVRDMKFTQELTLPD